MAKKKKEVSPVLEECLEHYNTATDDNDIRRTRPNGWNDVLKAYFGELPSTWPYLAMVTDPIIRTTILEKTARLFNGKLRGKLVPREGGDVVKAKVNNAILEYQWDQADNGGAMIEKWALMDMQTRLFGASFALCYWKTAYSGDKVTFDGNEMKVLDNRDVFVDYTANHVKNANWVQVREWKSIKDLEEENNLKEIPIYDLNALKDSMSAESSDRRENKYESIVKSTRGLEDRVGDDRAFPTLEIVTEYRKDRWITFAPRYACVLRDIENPYKHRRIPVVQLRYYPVGDDVYGESEVESVLPIWRGINALLCGAIDEINLRMKPPIKVANSPTVRMDTLEYGPNAVWLTGETVNNVQEVVGASDVINNFQAMYSALKASFSNAMGEMSQGVSQADPFNPQKTATEIRSSDKQKMSRDQYNQLYLEQALKDQMMIWLVNNQQFMFDDPTREVQVVRIVGKDTLKDLQRMGLDEMTIPPDAMTAMSQTIKETGGQMSGGMLDRMAKELEVPKYPVITNPEDPDPMNYNVVPKLEMDENNESAKLHILPEDFDGVYDYIPSVSSMALNADETKRQGRQQAIGLLLNPALDQKLMMEQEKTKIKEILIQVLEDNGVNDAEKYFETIEPAGVGAPQGIEQAGGIAGAGGMGIPAQANVGQGEVPVPQPQRPQGL